jgi:AraC-like DNA-binding protein
MNESLVSHNDRKIEESIDYILSHFHEQLKVKELAEVANCSSSHFFLIFKRKTGYSPINYLIRLRMRRACFLLETTNGSVKGIAHTLGYKDRFYFSRLFKSFNKMAPTAYRTKARNIHLLPLQISPTATLPVRLKIADSQTLQKSTVAICGGHNSRCQDFK